LHVNSYADWEPDNSTPAHAKDKIARAKAVLEELKRRSAAFYAVAEPLPHEHYCCYDYGTGVFAIAKEVGGAFEWLHKQASDG
jgi:hypothetical protein